MKWRIAIISEHASPLASLGGVDSGGQNVYVGQVASRLAAVGHEVDVFTRRDSPSLPEVSLWTNGVRVIHVSAGPHASIPKEALLPHMDAFCAGILRHCRRRGYDLVHANFWMSGLVAAEIKRALGIPFVVTFHALGRVRRAHQGATDTFPDERFAIEERIVAEADRLIAECPQDEEDLIHYYDADPEKIARIPCGFDPTEMWPISKPLARATLGLGAEERVLLQLGRMVPRKGVDTAIVALSRLVHEHDLPARLLIVGGEREDPGAEQTPEISRLQAVAAAERVSDAVTFVGRREREALKYYYSAADMFITAPWYEPFGITPLEAMACGTPVIGSNVGGIKHTVRDGETGYLVPAKDPGAIAERVAHLYRNPKLLALFGRRATERVNGEFTWEHVTNAIADLYADVLGCQSVPSPDIARSGLVEDGFEQAIETLGRSRRELRQSIFTAAEQISASFGAGGKLLACGNGGSAAEAQHLTAELVGRFRLADRAALPAISLNSDTAVLTAWANDAGYEQVFARQVEALGRAGDVLVGISTSGRSPNLVRAFEAARRQGMHTLALLGGDGGQCGQLADVAIVVPASDTQRIQEVQLLLIHLLCELVEARVAGEQPQGVAALRETSPAVAGFSRAEAAPVRAHRRAALRAGARDA
jgi:D-inositol-3-phosphate glycosyltransferase